jgi:hypothetical protein
MHGHVLPSQPEAPRLLEQVREAIRVRHYSLRTEQTYVGWIKRFMLFHGKRHPRDMGGQEVQQFLSHLAVAGHVAASTQSQALSAVRFHAARSNTGYMMEATVGGLNMALDDIGRRNVIVVKEALGCFEHGAGATGFRQSGARMLSQDVGQLDQALGPSQIAKVGVGKLGDGPAGGIEEVTHARLLEQRVELGMLVDQHTPSPSKIKKCAQLSILDRERGFGKNSTTPILHSMVLAESRYYMFGSRTIHGHLNGELTK